RDAAADRGDPRATAGVRPGRPRADRAAAHHPGGARGGRRRRGGVADPAAGRGVPAMTAIDGSGTARARRLLAPNPSPMTLEGTNTWVIAEPGTERAVVVDPGPDDPAHLRRVAGHVSAAGQRVTAILLTHSHPDHAEGAASFAAMTGAPVLAADPAFRLGDEGLAPGAVVTHAGCEIAVLATPGHTADSVCLHVPADRALLTGDTVLGR